MFASSQGVFEIAAPCGRLRGLFDDAVAALEHLDEMAAQDWLDEPGERARCGEAQLVPHACAFVHDGEVVLMLEAVEHALDHDITEVCVRADAVDEGGIAGEDAKVAAAPGDGIADF